MNRAAAAQEEEEDVTSACVLSVPIPGGGGEDLHSLLCQGISSPAASGRPSRGSCPGQTPSRPPMKSKGWGPFL